MKKLYVLFILLFAISSSAQESLRFDLIFKGKPIGVLEAEVQESNGVKEYKSHTKIDYHFMIRINLEYMYDVTYTNNGLQEANVDIFVHDKEKTKTLTKQSGPAYEFFINKKAPKRINSSIDYSTILLLFNEPKGVDKVYAEEHGEFHSLKKVGIGVYKKTNPKGKVSTYYYTNGKLSKAEIDAGIISFSLKTSN